jgi:hypothetical protein
LSDIGDSWTGFFGTGLKPLLGWGVAGACDADGADEAGGGGDTESNAADSREVSAVPYESMPADAVGDCSTGGAVAAASPPEIGGTSWTTAH